MIVGTALGNDPLKEVTDFLIDDNNVIKVAGNYPFAETAKIREEDIVEGKEYLSKPKKTDPFVEAYVKHTQQTLRGW